VRIIAVFMVRNSNSVLKKSFYLPSPTEPQRYYFEISNRALFRINPVVSSKCNQLWRVE